ncbi:AAA family ATPase [Olsenella sp. oral taxon 807]|uniref:AAA family ATPase n=1 Tax=Olsenella sp. oral taxon 807 TaxID=712411 RepID=UPI000A7FF400|nr:AAA family ATPase [Olsenella sp. oral taxon 807]
MTQYIRRSLEPLVRRYADNFKVVVVVGPRQVGKTTMLRHLMEEVRLVVSPVPT